MSRGGKRDGSGRKPLPPDGVKGRKQPLVFTALPPDLIEKIDILAEKNGSTRSKTIRDILQIVLQ